MVITSFPKPVWEDIASLRDGWMAIGLSTEEADRSTAERAVDRLYAAHGLPAPVLRIWMSSPLGGCLGAAAVKELGKNKGQLGDQVWGQLGGQLGDQLGDQLGGQLGGQLGDQLRDQLGDQLRDQLGGQLRGQLGNQLGGQLWGQLGGQLGDQLGDQLRDQLGGQLRDQLWDQLRGQLRDQLGDQLRGQLWDQLRGQLGDQVWGQLGGQLGDQLGGQLWDQLGNQLGGQLGDQLRDQLGDQLRGQLWDQLRGQLGGQLWDQLGNQLGGQLGDQLRDQLWDQLWGQLRDQLGDQLWDQLRGQLGYEMSSWWEAYGLAWYRGAVLGGAKLKESLATKLTATEDAAKTHGWWWPMHGAVVLTDRPSRLFRDNQDRLHAGDGPAIGYRDGYGLWAWHGVRVTQQIIESPETLKPAEILQERNAEIRRVMVERFGPDRLMSAANPEVLHQDVDGVGKPRRLLRIQLAEDEPLVMVEVVNSSPEPDGVFRNYILRVPPDTQTCHQAIAWTFQKTPEEYEVIKQS